MYTPLSPKNVSIIKHEHRYDNEKNFLGLLLLTALVYSALSCFTSESAIKITGIRSNPRLLFALLSYQNRQQYENNKPSLKRIIPNNLTQWHIIR